MICFGRVMRVVPIALWLSRVFCALQQGGGAFFSQSAQLLRDIGWGLIWYNIRKFYVLCGVWVIFRAPIKILRRKD